MLVSSDLNINLLIHSLHVSKIGFSQTYLSVETLLIRSINGWLNLPKVLRIFHPFNSLEKHLNQGNKVFLVSIKTTVKNSCTVTAHTIGTILMNTRGTSTIITRRTSNPPVSIIMKFLHEIVPSVFSSLECGFIVSPCSSNVSARTNFEVSMSCTASFPHRGSFVITRVIIRRPLCS